MAVAGLQDVPSKLNASEPLSTAAQKPGDEHDTDAMPAWAPGTVPPELHLLPLNRKVAESRASTARQKRTVGQDTESGSPSAEVSPVGWLHVVPS